MSAWSFELFQFLCQWSKIRFEIFHFLYQWSFWEICKFIHVGNVEWKKKKKNAQCALHCLTKPLSYQEQHSETKVSRICISLLSVEKIIWLNARCTTDERNLWDHPFGKCAKFFEKLLFLTTWYVSPEPELKC